MSEPTDGLQQFQSVKRVLAGEITEVVPAGCYVKEANGCRDSGTEQNRIFRMLGVF